MMVSNNGSFFGVLRWQWRASLSFQGFGAAAYLTHDVLGFTHTSLPAGPATVVGAALGIFASFRVNAAYARWWEGRLALGPARERVAHVHVAGHGVRR